MLLLAALAKLAPRQLVRVRPLRGRSGTATGGTRKRQAIGRHGPVRRLGILRRRRPVVTRTRLTGPASLFRTLHEVVELSLIHI